MLSRKKKKKTEDFMYEDYDYIGKSACISWVLFVQIHWFLYRVSDEVLYGIFEPCGFVEEIIMYYKAIIVQFLFQQSATNN
jgi:hypothetical protein